MKTLTLTLVLFGTLLAGHALAYNMINAAQVKQNLTTQAPQILLDIQVAEDYAKHHLPGALKTTAYPVKSTADQRKLDAILGELQQTTAPIVIICPRGKGGAKRTYDYLKEQGIPEERLAILEKGQAGWPYAELVASQ